MGLRLLLVVLVAVLVPCGLAAAEPAEVATYGAEVVQRDAEDLLAPGRFEAEVAAFERSWAHRALALQADLAGDVGTVDAPWVGTHNSFNSIAEMGPALSVSDANQRLSIVDQLRIGVRSLELDVHLWLGRPTVCHAQSRHEGCSVERPLTEVLDPIAGWLRAHPGEVVLLYLEDHLDTAAGYAAGAEAVRGSLGSLLYAPRGSGCTDLPPALTRDEILAAGAQVVIVSDCGTGSAWPAVAHSWETHGETRPRGFRDAPDCGPDFTRADYDTRLIRYFEDSTWLTRTASEVGAAERDDGITPATVAAMARCGVDLFGLDQLVPGDGRLEALVWSWAPGEPAAAGDCATAGADGRWSAAACRTPARAACRTADGAWLVPRPAVPADQAPELCARAGAAHAAPRTGWENELLRAAAGGTPVRLGLVRDGAGWRALDPR